MTSHVIINELVTHSKRAARKNMYTKVTMNVDDENVRLDNDEGSPTHFRHICALNLLYRSIVFR